MNVEGGSRISVLLELGRSQRADWATCIRISEPMPGLIYKLGSA